MTGDMCMLDVLPALPVSEDNARAVALAFNQQVTAARQQQQTTAQLAQQLRQHIQQAVSSWEHADQQQFMQLFNQCLRTISMAQKSDIADKKHFGYYFAILSGILFFVFLAVAVFAALTDASVFNGSL
jgi:hypothetical protein